MKVIQDLSYPIRLSATIKEYKEIPLDQRKVTLTPWNIEDTQSSSFWLWPGTTYLLPLLLRIMVFLEVEMQGSILIHPTNWCEGLQKVVILRLMGSSATRKSSNEHGFFMLLLLWIRLVKGGPIPYWWRLLSRDLQTCHAHYDQEGSETLLVHYLDVYRELCGSFSPLDRSSDSLSGR